MNGGKFKALDGQLFGSLDPMTPEGRMRLIGELKKKKKN